MCLCFSLQHLPFILLPDEVGPLYRIGSNMLAIRDLQCISYLVVESAVVTQFGVGNFSRSSPYYQCFYGTSSLSQLFSIVVGGRSILFKIQLQSLHVRDYCRNTWCDSIECSICIKRFTLIHQSVGKT